MHCVSLHQYWASLMEVGAKKIETRHWSTNYRGPLAIQAAGMLYGYVRDEYNKNESVRAVLREHFGVKNFYEIRRKLPFGSVVCTVDLTDVIQVPTLPLTTLDDLVPEPCKTENWQAFGDFRPGRFLWLTTNLRRLREPVKLKARQNVWPLTEHVIAEITKRI